MKLTILILAAMLIGCTATPTTPTAPDTHLGTMTQGHGTPITEEEQTYLITTDAGPFETQNFPPDTYPDELGSGMWRAYALYCDSSLKFKVLCWNGGEWYWENVERLNQR